MAGFDKVFQGFMPLVGLYAGKPYDIYRPDYSQSDNTPRLVQAGVKFRVDPTTGRFSEPRFEGVMYYDTFGQLANLKSGDLLVRSTAVVDACGVPHSADNSYPVVTIISFDTLKSVVAIRTHRIGTLRDSKSDPESIIYNPVYFDWLGQGFPGSQLNRNLADSLKIPSQRAVIYNRPNLTRLRSHLVETDLNIQIQQDDGSFKPFQRTWLIEEIDQTGPMMVLTLRNS